MSRAEEVWGRVSDRCRSLVQDARDAYREADRYARMRLWVVAVVVVDLLVTVGYLGLSGERPDLELWYRESFPSNLLIVRNHDDDAMRNVRIVLDDRYRLELLEVPGSSVQGYPMDREFHDVEGRTPGPQYRPRSVRLTRWGQTEVRPIGPVADP